MRYKDIKIIAMKTILYLCILLSSCFVFGQNKDFAIKIFLEDAYTGKKIKDAKVTLEGFEIPEIVGKYDKKGKFYYFSEIPEGYNTVMAYHNKYNEKGFQDTAHLPKELKLSLFNEYRVRIPNDSLNYYKEDPTKMVVVFNEQNIEQISKCEGFDDNLFLCSVNKYVSDTYPELTVKSELGLSSLNYSSVLLELVNKKKFKRFNDPVIKRIQDDKNILVFFGLLLKTKVFDSKSNTNKQYFSKAGESLYRAKFLRYINFDTINRYRSNYKGKYVGVNVDYRRKYFKGLLINNVYRYTKKELDSMYASDRIIFNKGYLFDFESGDTISINMYSLISNMPSSSITFLPYKAISNLLDYDSLEKDYSSKGEAKYSFYYSKNKIQNYKKAQDIIETKESVSNSTKIYKLKNNLASPYGILDLLEYYNLKTALIYQKTENIFKNDNTY